MRSVKDKVVVVTGSSRGIGAAIARIFANEGAKVVLHGRDKKALEESAKATSLPDDRQATIIADVTTADGMRAIIDTAYDKFGVIDIFVNNAGVGINRPIVDTTEAQYDQIMDTNLKAVFHCFRELLPRMLKQGFGQIINISSGTGRIGQPGLSVYAASKAALNVFSEAVAGEVRNDNIKICVLSPASTDTKLMSNMLHESRTPSRAAKKLTVDEVAEAVLYLARQNENAWTSMADIRPLLINR